MSLEHFVPPAVRPVYRVARRILPRSLRSAAWDVWRRSRRADIKYDRHLTYWQARYEESGGRFDASHYEKLMIAMAGEVDGGFVAGKIVGDFGCGPRGSLEWARQARARIGIDVMADAYTRFGIGRQDMIYVCSGEDRIPLPSNYVDVLFTVNALDHVADLGPMCREMVRIIAPGGLLVGSFNLDEPPTLSEPSPLTEEALQQQLLAPLQVERYQIAAKGPKEDGYRHFLDGSPPPKPGEARRILWVRAVKPPAAAPDRR